METSWILVTFALLFITLEVNMKLRCKWFLTLFFFFIPEVADYKQY